MTISGGSALPKDEIDRMVRDAEAHADEDRKRREEAETRNGAEQLLYSTEKFVSENADKIPDTNKAEVNVAIAELRTALEGTDIDAVKAKHENLAKVSQAVGTAMYAAAGEAAGSSDGGTAGSDSSAGASSSDDDDVVDAEIVDEDK